MGFLSRLFGNNPKPLPKSEADPARYEGRPLLVVLENYVLDCIGELAPDKQGTVRKLVQTVWGGDADWKKTVREQLDLQETLDEHIRRMWENNKSIARQNNTVLHSVQFAKMVVDENFSELI